MIAQHKYNGIVGNQPNNFEGVAFQLTYDADGNPNISTSLDLELSREAYEIAINWAKENITQGLPYEVDIKGVNLFDGYINLFSAFFNERTKQIEAQAERTGGLDWLSLQGEAVTFEFLYEKGFIKDSDFVDIPYVINRVGRNSEVFLSLLSAFVIQQQLRLAVKDITGIISEAGNPFTSINAVIKLVATILYITLLFASLAVLILEIISLLINPVKYHKGMKVLTMINKMCEYYGLEFRSSILNSDTFKNMAILPEKWAVFQGEARRFLGRISKIEGNDRGYFRGNFKDLLEALRSAFYAKIRVIDNVLYFEPDSFRIGTPQFRFPQFDYNGQRLQHNFEDFYSTFILEFLTDTEDRNTILEIKGSKLQVTTLPQTIPSQMRNLAGRLNRVTIPFALARRKQKLNVIETIINGLFVAIRGVINTIVNLLNSIIRVVNRLIRTINSIIRAVRLIGINIRVRIPEVPALPTFTGLNQIEDRRNFLVLENDFVDVPKIMLLRDDGKLQTNQENILNTEYLYNNYHFYRSFVRGNNQWKVFELPEIQISFEEWQQLRENDFATDFDGNEVQVLEANFNPYKQTLQSKIRVREQYIFNLNETITLPE
jgi:hypothetical protein